MHGQAVGPEAARWADYAFDPATCRRIVFDRPVVMHCHHYNARIQRTIESAAAVDGVGLFVATAEEVFLPIIREVVRKAPQELDPFEVAGTIYSYLGYGKLDFDSVDERIVRGVSSHFAEGWRVGFPSTERKVCSLARGFIQAAVFVATGNLVDVEETHCCLQGGGPCEFSLDRRRVEPIQEKARIAPDRLSHDDAAELLAGGVDSALIIDTLGKIAFQGAENGLIAAFNVYLASTPADFYNLVILRFLAAMDAAGMGMVARELLIRDAENCGMNTFRGIRESTEWDCLIAPMVQDERDEVLAIVAVSNALGWGRWQVTEHSCDSLSLRSGNGYEASGSIEFQHQSSETSCLMLVGVAAGVMQLVYGSGSMTERQGQFLSTETTCRSCGDDFCRFTAERSR